MAESRVKTIVRTVSKLHGFSDPSKGFYFASEVDAYVSRFLEDGYILALAEVIDKAAVYPGDNGDKPNAGVEIMYILQKPKEASLPLAERKTTAKRRGRPPKQENAS